MQLTAPPRQRQTIEIVIPAPHSDVQRQILNAFRMPGLEEMWVACGTKFGKTLAASGALALAAPLRPDTRWRWIAPIYMQSKIGFRYLKKMLPPEPYCGYSLSDPSISFPSIETVIEFFHGQNATSIEGEGCSGYIFDEAAKLKEDVHASAQTTTTITRGPICGLSTPFGKNWFFRKCMLAKEEMARAAYEKRPPKQIFLTAPTALNPKVPRESIERARRNLPDRLFRQYYMAEFIDDGSVFQFLNEAFGGAIEFHADSLWYAPDGHESNEIYIGADWAKTNDYSCFYALNDKGNNVGYKHFNRVPYPEQVAALMSFASTIKQRSTNKACHVYIAHDATGIGEVIDDIINGIDSKGFTITGVKWTNNMKEVAVSDMILSLEEKILRLRAWQTLKTELEIFEGRVTKSGNFVYCAPPGMKDDTVMTIVLANRLFREYRGHETGVVVLDSINETLRRIHYNGGVIDDLID